MFWVKVSILWALPCGAKFSYEQATIRHWFGWSDGLKVDELPLSQSVWVKSALDTKAKLSPSMAQQSLQSW